MTAPVPLAEQPTTDLQFVERHLRRCENEWKKVYPPYEQDDIDREIASFRRVLATLQQHERAMAALRPFARRADYFDNRIKANGGKWKDDDGYCDDPPSDIYLAQLREAREALDLDGKTSTAGDTK